MKISPSQSPKATALPTMGEPKASPFGGGVMVVCDRDGEGERDIKVSSILYNPNGREGACSSHQQNQQKGTTK